MTYVTAMSSSRIQTIVGKGSERLPGPIGRTQRRVGKRSPPASTWSAQWWAACAQPPTGSGDVVVAPQQAVASK